MNDSQLVDCIEIFDWYDGLVSGIISTSETRAIGSLLAFDAARNLKIYAIVPITDSSARQLIEIFEAERRNPLMASPLCQLTTVNEVFLTSNEPLVGRRISVRKVSLDERERIELMTVSTIDEVTEPQAIRLWLGKA